MGSDLDRLFHAPLAAFRSGAVRISPEEFALKNPGELSRIPGNAREVRVYPTGLWIAAVGDRIEGTDRFSEYQTPWKSKPGRSLASPSLENVEQIIFEWIDLGEEEKSRAFDDGGTALRRMRLKDLAVALMATRPDLEGRSLAEWLDANHGSLTANERAAARAINDLLEDG